jgi:hypothetical protein
MHKLHQEQALAMLSEAAVSRLLTHFRPVDGAGGAVISSRPCYLALSRSTPALSATVVLTTMVGCSLCPAMERYGRENPSRNLLKYDLTSAPPCSGY